MVALPPVFALALALASLCLWAGPVRPVVAQGGWMITRWVVAGGGGPLAGGSYALGATIGQAAAGPLAPGQYSLVSGFWGGASSSGELFLPLVSR